MITLTFKPELVDKVITSIMENYPEASATLTCTKWNYKKLKFTFEDQEDGKIYKISKPDLVKAFELMLQDNKWPKGCTPPPANDSWDKWDDWLCQCDCTDHDAFAQLACLGEVIYG